MKKFIAIVLVLSMLGTLAGCASDGAAMPDAGLVSSDAHSGDTTPPQQNAPEKEWGVTERLVVEKDNQMCRVLVNFADYLGQTRATGRMAEQKDGSIMIIDGQGAVTTIEIPSGKAEDIFPAYFAQTEAIMSTAHVSKRKNFTFTIESKETVTINGYEMCKVKGTHTYSPFIGDEVISQKFVAYATFAKANGAVVNWMVLDGTPDGLLENSLEDLGRKMAESFKEAQ